MKRVTRKIKKYLIPHEGNDYQPHLLRARAIGFICLMMVAAEVAVLAGPSYVAFRSQLFGIVEVNALVDGTNANRISNGASALTVNPLLMAAAREKANDMVKNNYFAHTSPAGVTPWYWFQNVGYNFLYAGENLAVNFSDSEDVTNAWMNSPEHRANILNANYTDIGIATATGTYEGKPAIYVVELFGAPAVVTAPVAIASPPPTARAADARAIAPTTPTEATSSQVALAAVKGASTENLPVTSTPAENAPAVPAAVSASPQGNYVPQNNPLQDTLAAPHQLSNSFYLLLIILMAGALLLNFFIQIRIQHPALIFNGVFVIALAALCIVLNQHQLLAHAMIF